MISDTPPKLYNQILHKHLQYFHRSKLSLTLEITRHLVALSVPLSHSNQLEVLLCMYLQDEQALSEWMSHLGYCIETNVFNFIFNLALDQKRQKLAISMIKAVMEGGLRVKMEEVDASKDHLKSIIIMLLSG